MKTALVAAVWVLLLAAAGGVALHLWFEIGEVSLGFHGWLALGLGVGVSLILGVGLMMLVFHSARRGYDDVGGAPDGGAGGQREKDGDDAQR
jgi:membrane protein implicated in regulation of membrane protease activity